MKKMLPFLLLALAACGKPQAGDSCSANTATCESNTEALLCESGTYRAIDCNGPLGCVVSTSGSVSCDYSRARIGDACPTAEEGLGQCHAANANELLLCQKGTWRALECKSCAVQGSNVVCQP
jgi:hypothetical protein